MILKGKSLDLQAVAGHFLFKDRTKRHLLEEDVDSLISGAIFCINFACSSNWS